jgi:LysR family glycine cleavage system transcriptional activator
VHAFEAAARHQSFARAGIELGVSAGAVSRQIKLLEQHPGTELFARQAQGVQLTDHGRRLLPIAARAFDLLQQMLPGQGDRDILRLRVSASFYLCWLMPRLQDLKREMPKLKLDLVIGSGGTGETDGVDGTIFYRRLDRSIAQSAVAQAATEADGSDLLFDDGSILVCAPALIGRRRLPLAPASLRQFPLLLNTPDGWDWQMLAGHLGLKGFSLRGAAIFDIDDAAIQAALAGQGMALVERRFVGEALAKGQLIAPFKLPALCLGQYRLRWSESALRRRDVRQVRDWLRQQAAG